MQMDISSVAWRQIQYMQPNGIMLKGQELDAEFPRHLKYSAISADTMFVVVERKQEHRIREAFAHTPSRKLRHYAFVPDCSSPRWLIPVDNRRVTSAALRLYKPYSLKGRLFKHVAVYLSLLGIERIWGKDRLFIALKEDPSEENAREKSLTEFLEDILNVPGIYLSFSMGTPGYFQKTTVQVMSPEGKVLAYAKIGDTPQARCVLAQEAKTLRYLESLDISTGRIPRLIYAGQLCEAEMVLQSAPEHRTHDGPKKLGKNHVEFLAEVFNQSKVEREFEGSEYWRRIRRDFNSLQEGLDESWRRRIQSGLDICERILTGKTIPFGLCHRDFTPWNTLIEQGRLYVFDWEYAVEEGIPFWDIFHFTLFPAILVRRRSGSQIITRWNSGEMRQSLDLYAQKVGVDTGLIPAFFLLYLIEVSCFYLSMFNRDGIQNEQRSWMREIWAEVIDELVVYWERHWNQWK